MADFEWTPSGGSLIEFTELAVASNPMGTVGKYWAKRPNPLTPVYGVLFDKSGPVAGKRGKRFDFDERDIENIELIYVDSSEANLIAAYLATQAATLNKACVLQLPGYAATHVACECFKFEPFVYPDGRIIKPTGIASRYRMKVVASFTQMRTS